MQFSTLHKLFLGAYGAGWTLALPFLARARRLRRGFKDRLAADGWAGARGWDDVWIQAASGGEAYLAWELMRGMPVEPRLSLLATTNTEQGMDILDQALDWRAKNRPGHPGERAYFPFDSPHIMRRALNMTLPKVVALLETELWPGLLAACAAEDVPVVVLNARMTSKSLAGYLGLAKFFKAVAPREVLAVSEADAQRFATLFGAGRVRVMPNMKFDRFALQAHADQDAANPLTPLLGQGVSLCVLGSLRAEEEPDALAMVRRLREERPKTTLGLFPRHMERVDAWQALLRRAGLPFLLRSRLAADQPAPAGAIILWDAFGELNDAYALARAAFVGGSLKPLGGQNFLEPLAHGIVPCIGPHWSNFAWVGRDIVAQGLAREARDAAKAAETLVALLKRPLPKDAVQQRARAFFDARRGGGEMAAQCVLRHVRPDPAQQAG